MGSLRYRPLIACIALLMLGDGPSAQTDTPAATAFEVASVKPESSGDTSGIFIQGTAVTIRNLTVRGLVNQAYYGQYLQDEIVGGPAWLDGDRFAITAKMPRPGGNPFLMLRTLLVDRFKLVTHVEQRERQVYNLVIARADRRLGRSLIQSAIDCQRLRAEKAERPCGLRNQPPGTLVMTGSPIQLLVTFVTPAVGRRVFDRTGLTGNYDADLRWNPGDFGLNPGATLDNGGPSIFTAIQEQLGLKLEAAKAMVPVLVIDSIERPQED